MPAFGSGGTTTAPSPFGASLTPAKPATPGFSFGATGAAGAGAGAAPAFGAAPTSTPAFGAAPTSTPAFGSTGAFGNTGAFPSTTPTPPAPSAFGSTFGNANTNANTNTNTNTNTGAFPSTSMMTMTANPPTLPDDSAIRELQSIQESYVPAPGNSRFKFQYLFLNVVKDPAQRRKPADIDELQWREAIRRAGGPDNPHSLWPIPYNGFKGLLDRKSAQSDAVKEHRERLEALQKSVAALANRHETVVRVQMEAIKTRHAELSQNLLKTLRYIDALEARFSRAVGYDKSTPKIVLQKLSEELRAMEGVIAANSAQGLLGRVDSVASAARVQVSGAGSVGGANGSTRAEIDGKSLGQAFGILKDYSDAIAKMNGAVHRNARDIEILKENSRQIQDGDA